VAVTAGQFTVELNANLDSFNVVGFDAQHYVARIGSYVLIPLLSEYVVAEVVGLKERDPNSSDRIGERGSFSDSGAKYLDLVPVGNLSFRTEEPFRFGVSVFPPLFADALYTETIDLDRIFAVAGSVEPVGVREDSHTRLRAFEIGTSVVFDNYPVKVRIDEFFGGHSAILGNTGSGKSCTVASAVQSVLSKPDELHALGATFVVFDTNGEYRQAFAELPLPIRRTSAIVPSPESNISPSMLVSESEQTYGFRLPHWYLSPDEWELLLRASERAQRPVLRTALGLTSLMREHDDASESLKNHVMASAIQAIRATSESATTTAERIRATVAAFPTTAFTVAKLEDALRISYGKFEDGGSSLEEILEQHIEEGINLPDYNNTPFEFGVLEDAINIAILYEESHGNRHIRDYCSTMLTRFKSIRDRTEFEFMRPEAASLEDHESTIDKFVEALLGRRREDDKGNCTASQITILDLNAVDDEIVQVISSVVTRLVFERLRRSEPRNSAPVNIVLEEAHRYIPERPTDFALDAVKVFERVAKEGRKYGVFLMIASQRPSELSHTVLSQCSNFVIHRIQNPEDLQHIRRMTPFISDTVLARLPSLPKQNALIFGSAVNLPTTFRVRTAVPTPKSADAQIVEIWFRRSEQIENE